MLLISGTSNLTGAIDGINTIFNAPIVLPDTAIVAINGLVRAPGAATENGYSLSGKTVTLSEPLVAGDILTVYVPQAATGGVLVVQPGGLRPQTGQATALAPTGAAALPQGAISGEATVQTPSMASTPLAPTMGMTGTAEAP